MALNMNELDARLRAVEERAPDAELEARVAELERRVGGMLTGQAAEISQEEKDRLTLSRRPNSYAEAVEFEAAQQRQAERAKGRPKKDDEVEARSSASGV